MIMLLNVDSRLELRTGDEAFPNSVSSLSGHNEAANSGRRNKVTASRWMSYAFSRVAVSHPGLQLKAKMHYDCGDGQASGPTTSFGQKNAGQEK